MRESTKIKVHVRSRLVNRFSERIPRDYAVVYPRAMDAEPIRPPYGLSSTIQQRGDIRGAADGRHIASQINAATPSTPKLSPDLIVTSRRTNDQAQRPGPSSAWGCRVRPRSDRPIRSSLRSSSTRIRKFSLCHTGTPRRPETGKQTPRTRSRKIVYAITC